MIVIISYHRQTLHLHLSSLTDVFGLDARRVGVNRVKCSVNRRSVRMADGAVVRRALEQRLQARRW